MNQPRLLSFIIPLHNEAESLPLLLPALRDALAEWRGDWEVIAVDDGSRDATWNAVIAATGDYPQLRGLRFSRNFGKEAAILAGLEVARGDWVVVMDGDGQHPPVLLPAMLAQAEDETVHIVAARKRERPADSALARVLAHLFNKFMHDATGLDLAGSSDYRLMKRAVVDALLAMPERIRFFRAMTVWTGFRQVDVDFDVPPRLAGQTAWTTGGLIRLAVVAITGFSAKPLTLVLRIGVLGFVLSVVLAAQALWSWTYGHAISGWTSLTLVMVFFGSSNLIGLGILGAYLAQLFDEIKARPIYLLAEDTRPVRLNSPAHAGPEGFAGPTR